MPRGFTEFVLVLALALTIDFAYPYHRGLLYIVHPVHTAYSMAMYMYRRLPKTRASGALIWFSVVGLHIALYSSALYLANLLSRALWVVFSSYILKTSISLKLLADYVKEVEVCLSRGDIDCARERVSHVVRRDVKNLGSGHVASAAIESLYESLVDGFTSPLLLYAVLGPLGALLQRLANTMDSALGYKEPLLAEVGWFSAKADTALNFAPARLTSILILLLCPSVDTPIAKALPTYLRYRGSTESVNAGHPMSAAAGCLQVRLEKIGSYTIAEGFPLPSSADISRALKLFAYTVALYIVFVCALFYLIHILAKPFVGSLYGDPHRG